MSSYMVDAKTLGACCDMIINQNIIDRWGGNWEVRSGWYRVLVDPAPLAEPWTIKAESFRVQPGELRRRLWAALGKMNLAALKARYGDDCNDPIPEYQGGGEYLYHTPAMAHMRVKEAHCFRYQCFEGNIPNTDLFQLFERTTQYECERIVKASPLYEDA